MQRAWALALRSVQISDLHCLTVEALGFALPTAVGGGLSKYSRLKKFEYGPGTIVAGFPSSPGFEVGAQSYSNFLASTVMSKDR